MKRTIRSYRLVLTGFCAATILSSPLHAQAAADEDPETLAEASRQLDSGIALARRQIADTDLLGAAGTLERVLIANPEAPEPRLLYASVLCRLDDSEGAAIEVRLVRPDGITDEGWREVTDACGALPRPTAPAPQGGTE